MWKSIYAQPQGGEKIPTVAVHQNNVIGSPKGRGTMVQHLAQEMVFNSVEIPQTSTEVSVNRIFTVQVMLFILDEFEACTLHISN